MAVSNPSSTEGGSNINIVRDLSGWTSSSNVNIERVMDDATYSSAHPDDTLVFAGPPRLGNVNDEGNINATMAPVGMVQNISVNQQKPFQPMMAIGSSRSFFISGKAQGSAQIQRLFMNSENLMRRLYKNIIDRNEGAVNPNGIGDNLITNPASDEENTNYLINLDSEFFLIPFGLGVIFKNKVRGGIGGFYMELCVIPNMSVSVQSGQSMIMEGVSLFFDRVVPLPVGKDGNLLKAFNGIIPNSFIGSAKPEDL